ncbi:Uncharacterised protein [Vibrio cholerae]|nr:Uncharacterised protein [Vibrio cholerae]
MRARRLVICSENQTNGVSAHTIQRSTREAWGASSRQ